MATVGTDFFRVDRGSAVRRLLVIAALLVTAGATAIGAHLMHGIRPDLAHLLSLGGGLVTLSGLILGFGAMAMLLFENVYLLITESGIVLHENGKETKIEWPELVSVRLGEQKGELVFERSGEPVRWFIGSSASEVVPKITDAQRKARHGLFKP